MHRAGSDSLDPYLVWVYGSLATAGFVVGVLFYVLFRRALNEPIPVLESVESPTRADEEASLCVGEYAVVTGKDGR